MSDADSSSSPKAVFLSYTSDDMAVALAVCEALRETGIEVWMDRSELQGGDAWDANIQRQIRECALIIPIISKRTQARREGYFRLEWRLADERMRLVAEGTPLIVPVVADETREQDALVPKSFLTVQWSRLPHGHVPPAFVARVRRLLDLDASAGSKSLPALTRETVSALPQSAPQAAMELMAPDVPITAPRITATGHGSISSGRSLWPYALTAGVALLVGIFAASYLKPAPKVEPAPVASKPLVRFAHDLPPSVSYRNIGRPVVALSPDGRSFVYNTTAGLFLRKMDEMEAHVISGTETAATTNPVFSPDNQSLAFFSGSELRKISISGGASVVIAPMRNPFGISWERDGTIVYGQADGVWQVPAAGGTPKRLLPAGEGETLANPQLLPDGKSILFSTRKASGALQIEVGSLVGGERKVVVPGGAAARYLPTTGHLLYVVDSDLFGIGFDPGQRATLGTPMPLLQDVRYFGQSNVANVAVSDDGTLLYLIGRDALTIPVWVDRQGKEEPLKLGPDHYGSFALSPDASKVAIGVRTNTTIVGLFVWDFAAETRTRLTLAEAGGSIPFWSPDGSRIVYDSYDGKISAKPVNNTRPPEAVIDAIEGRSARVTPSGFTPDGKAIIFSTIIGGLIHIGMISLEAKEKPTWLFNTPTFNESGPALSPDGHWLAYTSDESGRPEVYVSPFPKVNEDRILISNAGGDRPVWSHDGKELFYVGGFTPPTRRFMAAAVSSDGGNFKVVSRNPLWNGTNQTLHFITDSGNIIARPIGPSRDGQRFLVLKEVIAETTDPVPERIFIVQNWTEELKRRVPVTKK